jgi:phosphoribosyl 1,2-cyclic phosphodiesterase
MPAGMRVTFWGVRGSIPCPGPATVRYGGNTACLELRVGDGNRLVIIDAGSGIRPLGDSLVKNDLPKGPIRTTIFLSHTHWDHIMGFPFFTPIYIPGTKLEICGPVTYEEDKLDTVVGAQLSYRYFPVRQEELAADISYLELKEGTRDLGDGLRVTTKYLNHPILVLGYRFEYRGRVFCTAYDHEMFQNVFEMAPDQPGYDAESVREGALAAREENEKVARFFQGADLLVHDTQYTAKEYQKKKGWGHSTFESAINAAHKAGVKHLVLFHHDPLRTDGELTALVRAYTRALEGRTALKVSVAQEGTTIEV